MNSLGEAKPVSWNVADVHQTLSYLKARGEGGKKLWESRCEKSFETILGIHVKRWWGTKGSTLSFEGTGCLQKGRRSGGHIGKVRQRGGLTRPKCARRETPSRQKALVWWRGGEKGL